MFPTPFAGPSGPRSGLTQEKSDDYDATAGGNESGNDIRPDLRLDRNLSQPVPAAAEGPPDGSITQPISRRSRPSVSKVQTVEAIPVSYPEPNDFDALRHLCLVKITTDDGVVGWGESITQFPEANFAVKAIIEGMAERVVGKDPLDNIAIWHSLRDQMWWYGYNGGIASYAVAAIDIALWDIKGKLLGVPGRPAAGRRRPREAARGRLEPRPLRGHRPDGRGGPGVGRARDARPQGRLRQARQRAARVRARPGRRVHPQDARGPWARPDDHDRLRLEREMGRHDGRPARPGVR